MMDESAVLAWWQRRRSWWDRGVIQLLLFGVLVQLVRVALDGLAFFYQLLDKLFVALLTAGALMLSEPVFLFPALGVVALLFVGWTIGGWLTHGAH